MTTCNVFEVDDMNTAPDTPPDPGLVRYLKLLVTALAVTMVVGLIVLIGLFVMRFPNTPAPFPGEIALPQGVTASAITRSADWLAIVTQDGRLLIFTPDGKTLLQEIRVNAKN